MYRYRRRRDAAIVAFLRIKRMLATKQRKPCRHAWLQTNEREGDARRCRKCRAHRVGDTIIDPADQGPPVCPDREHAFVHAPTAESPFAHRCKHCGQERAWLEHA